MIVKFKQVLDDGIRTVCTVDEKWNWEGDAMTIANLKHVISTYNVQSIEDLPNIFYGAYFWASLEGKKEE